MRFAADQMHLLPYSVDFVRISSGHFYIALWISSLFTFNWVRAMQIDEDVLAFWMARFHQIEFFSIESIEDEITSSAMAAISKLDKTTERTLMLYKLSDRFVLTSSINERMKASDIYATLIKPLELSHPIIGDNN